MKEYILGFIGAGNMAQAIINGALNEGCLSAEKTFVYDVDAKKIDNLVNSCKIQTSDSVTSLCDTCDVILLAVKPNILSSVLSDIKDVVKDKTLVSIAAGWSADRIKGIVGSDIKIIRLMPNTPLLVGEGMSVFETPCNAEDEVVSFIEEVFCSLGKVEYSPDKLMDAVTAVSGSGPAYVYMFIEALADAGVLCGLQRDMSMTLATQTVLGAAKMIQETGRHPGELKDAVCSPGGTTIEAVKSLEQDGLRGAVINAAQKCALKSKELSN